MEIISLKCNSCGSDLQVNETTKFFNCSFCGSSLALRKSGNAVFTEVLDEIKGNTEAILDTSEKLLLEKQIARLDRDWGKVEQAFGEEDIAVSNPISLIIGVIAFLIIGGVFISNFNQLGPNFPLIFKIIPFIVGAMLFVNIVYSISKVKKREQKKSAFQRKELEYENKRQTLLNKIEELE